MVVEAGRALVLAYNKWDLVDEERRRYLEREFEQDLVQVQWAPRVNISARTGRHLERLVPALDTALESWEKRVPTGRLNALLAEIAAGAPAPGARRQAAADPLRHAGGTRPPRFVLFTTGFFEAGLPAVRRAAAARGRSASRGRRSRSRCGRGRSAGAEPHLPPVERASGAPDDRLDGAAGPGHVRQDEPGVGELHDVTH